MYLVFKRTDKSDDIHNYIIHHTDIDHKLIQSYHTRKYKSFDENASFQEMVDYADSNQYYVVTDNIQCVILESLEEAQAKKKEIKGKIYVKNSYKEAMKLKEEIQKVEIPKGIPKEHYELFYKKEVVSLDELKFISNGKYLCFLDFEFHTQTHHIISFGATLLNLKTLNVRTFYRVVKPKKGKKLDWRTKKITHLKQSEIDNAQSLPFVINEFFEFLNNAKVEHFCTWSGTDRDVLYHSLGKELAKGKYKKFRSRIVNIQPVISSYLTKNESQCISLSKAKNYLDLGESVSHNALDDSKDLKDVFIAFSRKYLNFKA